MDATSVAIVFGIEVLGRFGEYGVRDWARHFFCLDPHAAMVSL